MKTNLAILASILLSSATVGMTASANESSFVGHLEARLQSPTRLHAVQTKHLDEQVLRLRSHALLTQHEALNISILCVERRSRSPMAGNSSSGNLM
jgi:hypothetical protein